DEDAVILLLSSGCRAPLPVLDGVGTVADGLPCQIALLALFKRRVGGTPVDEGGLGFHDPKIFLLEAAGEVVASSVVGCVEVVGGDVVIPGGDVEDRVNDVFVEAVEPAHGVSGDELALVGVRSDGVDLVYGVALPGIADETLPLEKQRGVFFVGADGD